MFTIIEFLVDASYFHIYYIFNCIVMRYLPCVLLDIINFYLLLLSCGYNLLVYN